MAPTLLITREMKVEVSLFPHTAGSSAPLKSASCSVPERLEDPYPAGVERQPDGGHARQQMFHPGGAFSPERCSNRVSPGAAPGSSAGGATGKLVAAINELPTHKSSLMGDSRLEPGMNDRVARLSENRRSRRSDAIKPTGDV